MPYLEVAGATLFYKDWGHGRPVVFSHGWRLTADALDDQMLFLASRGFRCIAHDRRGHGRSTPARARNAVDTNADDLATLVKTLDLNEVIHVALSSGSGEVVRYASRYGSSRMSKMFLIGEAPPFLARKPVSWAADPVEVLGDLRSRLGNRVELRRELRKASAAAYHPGEFELLDSLLLGEGDKIDSQIDCLREFLATDFTGDVRKIHVPALVLHEEGNRIIPVASTSVLTSHLVASASRGSGKGVFHAICSDECRRFSAELLGWCTHGDPTARAALSLPSSVDASAFELTPA